MVKYKLNSFSEKTHDFNHAENERLSELFERFYRSLSLPDDSKKEYFKIYVNGEEVHSDLWAYVRPKKESSVLIVLVPKSGDTGRLLGQIGVTIAAIALQSNPYLAAAVAIFGNLLVNQLFPPPALDLGGVGLSNNQEDSQMYTISAQSNSIKKYGVVPKVYGEHRIFPTIAADPYTEFEVDKDTGDLIQYFYGVYDLGHGPMEVSDIKIGDSEIELFDDAYYRLVDFNKPATSEGSWDDPLESDLLFYKGDNNTESVTSVMNINSTDAGVVEDDYTVIRNADENPEGYKQQIALTFSFPQGLTTLATNGNNAARTVELSVQFAEVGTEDWRAFNDENYASSFTAIGDSVTEGSSKFVPYIVNRSSPSDRFLPLYSVLASNSFPYYQRYKYPISNTSFISEDYSYFEDRYGLKKGDIYLYSETLVNVNQFIKYGDKVIGKVKERTVHSGTIFRYELYTGIDNDIYIFRDFTREDTSFGTIYTSYYYDFESKAPPIVNAIEIEASSNGSFLITANKQSTTFATLKFIPITTNHVKVRVQRIRSYNGHTYRVFDDMTFSTLATRLDTSPIITNRRHVFLELRVKATDQLNGTIDNLSAVCRSVLDVYDKGTDTWNKEVTSNPAWIFSDILTGSINKRAISKSRLDTTSLIEWANFCDEVPVAPPGRTYVEPRYSANFVVDTATTVSQLINQLTSSNQASMNMINGKYGVLVDKLQTIPVQLFTPRNSWGFQSNRTYSELPDAIKVKYVDPGREWGVYEEIVYADGKDTTTAVNFEELSTFGCTNFEQSFRFGRYFLASAILRQENISIEVDFENLVCTRGDYVKLQHDVMKVGGRPARVKSISGNEIVIDDAFITETGINYGYTFRNVDGIFTGTMTITGFETATLNGDLPNAGDLLVWGEVDKITIDCLVQSIIPGDDLSATIYLIEKADAVYDAESSGTLPVYDPQLVKNIDADTQAPPAVENLEVVESSYRCGDGNYIYFVNLAWQDATGAVVDKYEVYVDTGGGYKLDGFSTTPTYEYIVAQENLEVTHNFKVIGLASNGSKLNLSEVPFTTDTPLRKTTPPSDVDALYINVLDESLQLDWDVVEDCDIDYYLVRYSPNTNASWSSSIPLQLVDRNTSLATSQARVGSYFVKAVDWAGNESENAASAITSIPSLTKLNIIEETNDFPLLPGEKEQVSTLDGQLVLQEVNNGDPTTIEYHPEGYYYYEELLDLGEIYTVRLQSLIEAEGFSNSDLMVNWATLSAVPSLSASTVSDWSVETEYRATNNFNTISEWADMASIDPISEGVQSDFTPWRKFTIGDFTGRIFQFRLKLISNSPNITPRVFDGVIKADMPDRTESYNDLNTTSGQYILTYDPPFKGPGSSPNIQITQDDAEQGDYYKITNKTLEGFTIKFYDKNDVLVDRQFDALIKGYGRKQDQVI